MTPRQPARGENSRLFVLLGFDPSTGHATLPVAVLGLPALGGAEVSWLPLREGCDRLWRVLLASCGPDWTTNVDAWMDPASTTVGIVEVPPPEATDAHDAVERLVDVLLADPISWPET